MNLIYAQNHTLQGVGEAGVNKPTGCSTLVHSWPRDDSAAHAQDIDTDMSAEVLAML
jgi:hypothetical protein